MYALRLFTLALLSCLTAAISIKNCPGSKRFANSYEADQLLNACQYDPSDGKLITNDDPRCLGITTLDIICAENRSREISEEEQVAHVRRAAVAPRPAKKKGKGRKMKSPLTLFCETQVEQVLILEPYLEGYGINAKLCRDPKKTVGKLDSIVEDTLIPVSIRSDAKQLRDVLVTFGFKEDGST
ncbi:hypothetical protein GALMADRAFT_225303 [Galerina marginata CBS 339.88]|uniref:Hydrophobin n=1 Tax=Galerina marginata (strain CBS 339.88) TaxID=685588 RepID=A0A067T1Z7_GALM3|nr:hypothetical protein GALMADRAFT_225303 [Galerina marginata CBS 339.88]